jgi:outer membrane protein assembly factor BamB
MKFDGIYREKNSLARSWGASGPPVRWSVNLGSGHAGAAVLNSRVYILDYDEQRGEDVLRCLALADGKELWRRAYASRIKNNHGFSRTVPAVTSQHCITIGPLGKVMCVDAQSGKFKWGIDLVKQFGTQIPEWYAGQCPLIDNGLAIIAPAGSALMIAVDCATGKIRWQTPNSAKSRMTHSSILPIQFKGKRMYVYCASDGVKGVSAQDGTLLWEANDWRVNVSNIPMPVEVGEGRLFVTGGYNAGSAMLQLEESGGRITAKTLFRIPQSTFGSHQQTPIFYKGHLYGVTLPDGQLVCLDLQGKRIWSSGRKRFGLGPYLLAEGMLIILSDRGELRLVEATASGYRELAQAKILQGHDAWAPLALAGGRLLARDLTRMVCVELKKQ